MTLTYGAVGGALFTEKLSGSARETSVDTFERFSVVNLFDHQLHEQGHLFLTDSADRTSRVSLRLALFEVEGAELKRWASGRS